MSASSISDKRASKGIEGKGNVLVSVRVRPDSGANDHGRVEGEWMVDGRKSLVSYRGKEGGDYIYGKIKR
jgi:centromeric protein E